MNEDSDIIQYCTQDQAHTFTKRLVQLAKRSMMRNSKANMENETKEIKAKVQKWLVSWWGRKCDDFEPTCACCQRWLAFERLFDET